jgi:hypothetical protein
MSRSLRLLPLLAMLPFAAAHAADWSDTSVGLRLGNHFAEPGLTPKIAKTIFNFTTINGDKLGTNLIVGDVLLSDNKDPAAGGGGGAQEFYGFYQRTFSLNALTGSKGFGFFKDLSLVGRGDLSAKNTTFAPRVRKLRFGIAADLPVPAGFWNVGVQAYHETNHNGIVGKEVHFDTAAALTSVWSIPIAGIASFGGFLDIVGPKGKDGFGGQTKTETLFRATLLADLGKTGLKAGVGLEYWANKFGNNAKLVPGSKVTTPMLLAEYHF